MRPYTQYYAYDDVGNMLQMKHTTTGGTGNWTRNFTIDTTSNKTLGNSIGSNSTVSETYTYDTRGNIVSGFNHLVSLEYNATNMLQKVEVTTSITTYYQYAGGQRVRKVVVDTASNITQVRKYIGEWEVYQKIDTALSAITLERETLHVMDDAARVALIDTPTIQPSGSSEVQLLRYQYSNHLSTATLELDDTAAIISYEEYYPYGSTSFQSGRTSAEVSQKRYRYIGKERDEETGFYYMGARYYVPWIARWVAVDPLEAKYTPESSYNYCHNNPVGWTDRTGMGAKKNGGDARITPANVVVSGSSTQRTPTPAKQPTKSPAKPFSSSIVRPSIGPVYDGPTPDKAITKEEEASANEYGKIVKEKAATRHAQLMHANEVADNMQSFLGSQAYQIGHWVGGTETAETYARNTAQLDIVFQGAFEIASARSGRAYYAEQKAVTLANEESIVSKQESNVASVDKSPGVEPVVMDVAGRSINPTRGGKNCAGCTIAGDATLKGYPASAINHGVKSSNIMLD